MVLEPGPFTDAKSPNRWMECSLMGLATVLSPIRSCTDLLEHGVHTRFARQPQDWVEQINQLLRHPRQRLQLVQQAQQLAWQQLGQEQAAALWEPLLQAQTSAPRRVLLVSEQISGAPLDPADRLGRDLLRNLLQPPHQAVDWMAHTAPPASNGGRPTHAPLLDRTGPRPQRSGKGLADGPPAGPDPPAAGRTPSPAPWRPWPAAFRSPPSCI